MELPSSELELNCLYRNWNWSGIAFIGIGIGIELPFALGTGFGIGVELPLSELELELNCKNGIDPSSDWRYSTFRASNHKSTRATPGRFASLL